MTRVLFRKPLLPLSLTAAVILTAPANALAQAAGSTATITGTVTDAAGAVVPGATIALTNPATGLSYKALTNQEGSYAIANVAPGPGYIETVSREGFQTSVLNGLYLNVGTTRSQDVKLAVGSVGETVSVSASNQDVTLDTTDSSVGNNFQVQYLNELPVALRDSPVALLGQQPGMTQDGSATGARTDQNRLTLDGLDVTDYRTGLTLGVNGNSTSTAIVGNAPVDSVQEFRGTTAGFLSSSGNGGGGQFDMVTKAGTNQFHGNINEYHRDTSLEANEWFNNFDGVPRAPLIRNQFGGNLGGPLWREKAFFFFDYNGRRDTISQQVERTVPTDSFIRNQTITYYTNLASGTTSSINAAQAAGFDPRGVGFDQAMFQTLAARYPSPNDFTGDRGDLLNTAGYRFNAPAPFKEDNFVGRLDIHPFPNHTFFARVTYNRSNSTFLPAQFATNSAGALDVDRSYARVVGWSWTIGSNKTNSLVWGSTIAKIGVTTPPNPEGNNLYNFDGNPTGGSFLDGLYTNQTNAQSRYFPVPVVRDDFSVSKGRHLFSIGGSFKYPKPHYSNYNDFYSPNVGLGGGVLGLTDSDSFSFRPANLDRNQTSLTTYDSALVFGLGRIGSVGATYNYNAAGTVLPQGTGLQNTYKYYETEVYYSDTWKATPSFTLTYGLRYQNYTVPYEVNGIESVQSQGFWQFMNARIAQSATGQSGPTTVPYITYNLGGKANHGPAYFSPSNKDFAPRVAFAWTPTADRKTVFSGGGGVVYDQTIINAILQEQNGSSYLFQSGGTRNFGVNGNASHSAAYNSLLQNPRFTSLNASPAPPAPPVIGRPYAPYVGPQDPNCGGVPGPCGLANGGAFNISVDKYLPTPYNITYNFGLEQQFKSGYLLRIDYVGRLGRHLLAQADAEQIIDFPDAASGQMLSGALANLTTWLRANPNANPASAPAQPWFEHVLHQVVPGQTNTGYIASTFAPYPARGDAADTIQQMAYAGMLPDNVGMAAQLSENTFFTGMGFSSYNGLLVTLHKNLSRGLQFDLNYTWSHSIDNTSLIANSYAYSGTGFICDVLRPRLCRGDSDFDVTNYLNGNFLYQVPVGHGRTFGATMPLWAEEAVGGWQISGLPVWHSGTPFAANSVAFLMSYSNEDPALLTGNKALTRTHVSVKNGVVSDFSDQATAMSQFTAPVGFQIGSRNNLRGPGYFNLDLGLGKTFPIYPEKVNLKFRADAFNSLNHPNFQSPTFTGNMSLVSPPNEFGVIPGTVVPPGSDQAARVLQVALRLEF